MQRQTNIPTEISHIQSLSPSLVKTPKYIQQIKPVSETQITVQEGQERGVQPLQSAHTFFSDSPLGLLISHTYFRPNFMSLTRGCQRLVYTGLMLTGGWL